MPTDTTVPSLTLLTSPDCHLCAHGREVLGELEAETGLAWREVSSDSPKGQRLAESAPPLRPVLLSPGGRPIAAGRLSLRRLRRDLTRAELMGGSGG